MVYRTSEKWRRCFDSRLRFDEALHGPGALPDYHGKCSITFVARSFCDRRRGKAKTDSMYEDRIQGASRNLGRRVASGKAEKAAPVFRLPAEL